MNVVVVKFEYSDTELDFDNDEIARTQLRRRQPRTIEKLQNGKPRIVFLGKWYHELAVGFDIRHRTTATNLETLRGQSGIIKVHYRYGYDGEVSRAVLESHMNRSSIPTPYYAGTLKRTIVWAYFIGEVTSFLKKRDDDYVILRSGGRIKLR